MLMNYSPRNFGLGGLRGLSQGCDNEAGPSCVDTGGSGATNTPIWADIASILTPLENTAGKILTSRYAVPQLQPGQYVSGGGLTAYQLQPGQTAFTGAFGTSAITSMLPILGIGLVLILALKR